MVKIQSLIRMPFFIFLKYLLQYFPQIYAWNSYDALVRVRL